jgi:hypothetical protein
MESFHSRRDRSEIDVVMTAAELKLQPESFPWASGTSQNQNSL